MTIKMKGLEKFAGIGRQETASEASDANFLMSDTRISQEPAELAVNPVAMAEVVPGSKEATVGTDTKKEAKTKDNLNPCSLKTKDKVEKCVGAAKTALKLSVRMNICPMRIFRA